MGADRVFMGALLLLELFGRLRCGICGPNPVPSRRLITAVQVIDPGYCLDAPDALPAGSMMCMTFPPDEGGGVYADQTICYREAQ